MDTSTGRIYPSLDAAILAGVKDPVLIQGAPEAIEAVSRAVRDAAKRKRKAQKSARRKNRA